MKVLRNAVNNEFSGAMDDVVHVLSEMRERMKALIKDGEFDPMEMLDVMGEPIQLIKHLSGHQSNISRLFDEAEKRYREKPKQFLMG